MSKLITTLRTNLRTAMNKIKTNFTVTFLYFEYAAKFILLAITFIILFTYPSISNAWHLFFLTVTDNQELFTAILSSCLVVSLIFDAGIYAGRWLDKNEERIHADFKRMTDENLKKIIKELKDKDSHES